MYVETLPKRDLQGLLVTTLEAILSGPLVEFMSTVATGYRIALCLNRPAASTSRTPAKITIDQPECQEQDQHQHQYRHYVYLRALE